MNKEHHHRLREAFIGWQCRIREYAVRKGEGRPSPGMRPTLIIDDQDTNAAITTVLIKAEPAEATTEFQYIVKKTHDPRLRFEAAIKKLQVSYFQQPKSFCDGLATSFSPNSSLVKALMGAKNCKLVFLQSSQRYEIPVEVILLDPTDKLFLATFWHNAMFNPNLSLEHKIFYFEPDWTSAVADPTPFA